MTQHLRHQLLSATQLLKEPDSLLHIRTKRKSNLLSIYKHPLPHPLLLHVTFDIIERHLPFTLTQPNSQAIACGLSTPLEFPCQSVFLQTPLEFAHRRQQRARQARGGDLDIWEDMRRMERE